MLLNFGLTLVELELELELEFYKKDGMEKVYKNYQSEEEILSK